MSGVVESEAKRIWLSWNQPRYRHFLSSTRKEALATHGVTDTSELRSKEPLKWVPSVEVWNKMIDHWCSDKFQQKSALGKKARESPGVRKDGTMSKSGYGRKDITDRILIEEKKTGKPVSRFKIIQDVNQKKDPAGQPTGEVHDVGTQAALDEVKRKWAATSADTTEEYPPNEVLGEHYLETEAVREGGLKKRRVLGCGSADQAIPLLTMRDQAASCSSGVGSGDHERAPATPVDQRITELTDNFTAMKTLLERLLDQAAAGELPRAVPEIRRALESIPTPQPQPSTEQTATVDAVSNPPGSTPAEQNEPPTPTSNNNSISRAS